MPRSKTSSVPKATGTKATGSQARRISAATAARIRADELRQAECAAMLIAVTRMLLNLRGRDFASWLRAIADDFDATDPDTEDPDDLGLELARKTGTDGAATADPLSPDGLADDDLAEEDEDGPGTGRTPRPH